MGHSMIIQVARGRESFAAETALMGLFTTMNPPVNFCKFISDINRFNNFKYCLWVFRLEDVEKPLLQTSQMCGFSPVCVLMCRFRRLGRSKAFPQMWQGNMVFSRALRPTVTVGRRLKDREEAVSRFWATKDDVRLLANNAADVDCCKSDCTVALWTDWESS